MKSIPKWVNYFRISQNFRIYKSKVKIYRKNIYFHQEKIYNYCVVKVFL